MQSLEAGRLFRHPGPEADGKSIAAQPRCKEAIMTTEAKQETQPAGQAAGVGQVLGAALQQQIAQALQPVLKELQQQMAQAVRQQMEQELEPVRQELHKQVDEALKPVQEELHKQIEQALEPMRQELQKQVDQVLQQEVENAVSSLFR
jgi:phosphoglycerate-specific signal transduction histidine kinase